MRSLSRFRLENKLPEPPPSDHIEPNAEACAAFRSLVLALTRSDRVAYGSANRRLRRLGWSVVPIRASRRGRVGS